MYKALKPGGALMIAEPLKGWRTEVPLGCMRVLDRVASPRCAGSQLHVSNRVLTHEELDGLLEAQPWSSRQRWADARYQYALCEKAPSVGTGA